MASTNLIDELRKRTRKLHTEAEGSGVIRELLRGQSDVHGHALYLRNLLPAYQNLEQAMKRPDIRARFGGLTDSAVYRSPSILADLSQVQGQDWRATLPVLPVSRQYAEHIERVAHNEPVALLGHIYTRYLGDLNGGQILDRVLARTLRLPVEARNFYRFPCIADLPAFTSAYLQKIADFAVDDDSAEKIASEAVAGFEYNIRLSMAVHEERKRDLLIVE